MPHDVYSKAPVSGQALYARCLGYHGPVPAKPNQWNPDGRMLMWFEFELRGRVHATMTLPTGEVVALPDIAAGTRVSMSATYPWDTKGFPPFTENNKHIPTDDQIERFKQPINWSTTSAPNGRQTLAGVLEVLGGKVALPDGRVRSNFDGIIGKPCKLDMNQDGSFVNRIFIDSDQNIWKAWEGYPPVASAVATQPAATAQAQAPALTPAPGQPPTAAPAPAIQSGTLPPPPTGPTVTTTQPLPAEMYQWASATLYASLKKLFEERGLDAQEIRECVTRHGTTSLAYLDQQKAEVVLLDIGSLAVEHDLGPRLPDLPNEPWASEALRSAWTNYRRELPPPPDEPETDDGDDQI